MKRSDESHQISIDPYQELPPDNYKELKGIFGILKDKDAIIDELHKKNDQLNKKLDELTTNDRKVIQLVSRFLYCLLLKNDMPFTITSSDFSQSKDKKIIIEQDKNTLNFSLTVFNDETTK